MSSRTQPPDKQLPLAFERAAGPPAGEEPASPAPAAAPPRPRGGLLRAAARGAAFGMLLVAVAWASGEVAMRFSLDKDKVDLPRVVGLESVAAIELLKERGLTPKVVTEEYSNRVARGQVASQQPSGAMRVRPGAEVRLVVSRGAESVPLPDLAGLAAADAQKRLAEGGFTAGTVTEVRAENHPPGVVIASDPAAGETVMRGTPVHLLVNAGGAAEALGASEVAKMPDLVGQPVRAALDQLQRIGVEAQVSFEQAERGRETVLRQEPAAGGSLRRGQRATLVVGQ